MCLGIPARVVSVETVHPDLASVELGGILRVVNIGLLDEPVGPGDWLLVHMGFALSTMTARQADAALDVFRDERRALEALTREEPPDPAGDPA
jgi:hydrogenase expression/formation protein HypC